MTDWRTLAEQVDREVDAQFGEPITLTPMRTGSDYSAGERDPTRRSRQRHGVLIRPVGRVVEGGGEVGRGGDFLSRVVETEMILPRGRTRLAPPARARAIGLPFPIAGLPARSRS